MSGVFSRLSEDSQGSLLQQARSGSLHALGQLLEACRGYLLVVARQELGTPLQAKMDAADLVQETFIEATRDFATFRGMAKEELLGWLRGILRHNLADLSRYFAMNCRRLSQEVPLHDCLAHSVPRSSFRGDGTSICEQLIAREQRRALAAALERLPPAYRQALQLRFHECRSFAEIGLALRRSPESVRKLTGRALERLRQAMRVYQDA